MFLCERLFDSELYVWYSESKQAQQHFLGFPLLVGSFGCPAGRRQTSVQVTWRSEATYQLESFFCTALLFAFFWGQQRPNSLKEQQALIKIKLDLADVGD